MIFEVEMETIKLSARGEGTIWMLNNKQEILISFSQLFTLIV